MEIFAGSLKYDAKLCAFILKYIVWIENKHCKDMQVLDKWNSESLLYILYKDFPVSVVSISTFFSLVQCTKGQLISKRNSQAKDSPKKQMNEFVLRVCNVFSFVFWANPRLEKNRFEIIWPLGLAKNQAQFY